MASATPWDSEVSYFIRRLLRQWPPLLGLLTIPLTTAVAFAALPVSRHRAKVRWWHVRRAAAYLFGIAAILITLIVVTRALGQNDFIALSRTSRPTVLSQVVAIANAIAVAVTIGACVFFPILLLWYWHACARHHLHMDQSWVVALSVLVIGLLASCAIAYWAGQWLR